MEALIWWNDRQRQLAHELKGFVDGMIPKAEEAWWKREFPHDLLKTMADKGYFGVDVPEKFGGWGLGVTGACIAAEEFSRMPGIGDAFITSMLGGLHHIRKFGTEEQRTRFMPRIARGEIGAIAITEPFSGTDAASIETTAHLDEDKYIVNGKKRFVTLAGVASRYMLYARTSDEPEMIARHRHLTGFVVEKGMSGFTVEKINELIGFDNVPNGYLDLDNVPVPVANRIGNEGDGWQVMMSGFNYERTIYGAAAMGWLREMLRIVVSYGQRRIQFGRPTIELPTNQFKIADIITKLKLTRLATYYAASLLDAGQEAAVESSMCKLFNSEAALEASVEAIQCMGGDGLTRFYPVERVLREAKTQQIAGGTNEAMKLAIYRLGLQSMAKDLNMPYRTRHKDLGVPVSSLPPSSKQSEINEEKLLKVLAENYRVNPGLYMSREDLKEEFDVDDADLDKILMFLEHEKLAKLYRRHEKIILARITYEGLRKANPPEYYRWFPSRVKKKEIF